MMRISTQCWLLRLKLMLVPFWIVNVVFRNMLAATSNIGIIMHFKLWTGALHFSDMKLGVVHNPGVLRFASKVFGRVTAQIRCNLPSNVVHFWKGLTTRHRAEVGRVMLQNATFFHLLTLATLYDFSQVSFSFLLLLLSCIDFLCFDCERLKRCFILTRSCWPFLKESIFNILIALAWPTIHFLFKLFLLCHLVPNLHYLLALREASLVRRGWSRVRKHLIWHIDIWVFHLHLSVLVIVDDLWEASLFYFFVRIAILEAQVVRDCRDSISTHHLRASTRELRRTDVKVYFKGHNCFSYLFFNKTN